MSPDSAFVLHAQGTAPFQEWPLALSGHPTVEAGEPVHYLRKEIIPIGETRKHPDKGYPIHVTPDRAKKWIKHFGEMSAAGMPVPAPPAHADRSNSHGRWVSLSLEKNARGGQSLFGILKVVGDASKQAVLNKDVSICTRHDLAGDQTDQKWDEAVEHIACTPYPALSNLSGWVSLAASRGPAEEVPVFELSAAAQEPEQMDPKQLREALGADESVPDADLLIFATNVRKERDDLKAVKEQNVALSRDLELARTPKSLDPELAHERRLRVADAVAKLGGTTAWNERAVKVLAGAEQAPDGLMLSRVPGGDLRAMDLLALVRDFVPAPKAGEQTGPQVDGILELGRKVPGETKDDPAKALTEAQQQAAEWQKQQLALRGLSA